MSSWRPHRPHRRRRPHPPAVAPAAPGTIVLRAAGGGPALVLVRDSAGGLWVHPDAVDQIARRVRDAVARGDAEEADRLDGVLVEIDAMHAVGGWAAPNMDHLIGLARQLHAAPAEDAP